MTVIYDTAKSDQPGTHVLAIAVGRYTHLYGGVGPLANKPLDLEQLQSPPASIKALLDWFLAPVLTPGLTGFVNAITPLATIDALASAQQSVTINVTGGTQTLDSATRDNIQNSFDLWLTRLKSHPDNVGVFYFCGHGIMVADHYLLAEDFGQSRTLPWDNAFDISTTINAITREVQGAVYYFIDACRQISREKAMSLGADPTALLAVDLDHDVIQQSATTVFATGFGKLAYAPLGGHVSRFTSALISALSGYCGIKSPGGKFWDVDGECVAAAIRKLLQYETLDAPGTATQVTEQWVNGVSMPLLRISSAPKVKVRLDITPTQQRKAYELYLLSAKGVRSVQTRLDNVFRISLPRGFYEVGAHDPDGVLPAIVHDQEELIPPMYPLTFNLQP